MTKIRSTTWRILTWACVPALLAEPARGARDNQFEKQNFEGYATGAAGTAVVAMPDGWVRYRSAVRPTQHVAEIDVGARCAEITSASALDNRLRYWASPAFSGNAGTLTFDTLLYSGHSSEAVPRTELVVFLSDTNNIPTGTDYNAQGPFTTITITTPDTWQTQTVEINRLDLTSKHLVIGRAGTATDEFRVQFDNILLMVTRPPVRVSNVVAAQQPGTKRVEIRYDVAADTPTVTVTLEVRDGETVLPATSLSGDIGEDVATGTGRSIVWDMEADWNGNVATLAYTVTADDGEPVLLEGGDPTATSWEEINERWVKNTYADGAETMSDRDTGLMWVYAPHGLPGNSDTMTWFNATDYCGNLTYAGHSDWRLPYVNRQDGPGGPVRPRELEDMSSQRHLFSGVQSFFYWTYCTSADSTDSAWYVYQYVAFVNTVGKTTTQYVWPVRAAH